MNSKIQAIIQRMENDREYREYFFKNSSKYQHLHLWLKPLYERGYFSPQNIPERVEDKNNKGFFSTPRWEVLNFLKAVCIQNKEENNNDVTELLLKIIKKIMKYIVKKGCKNYYVSEKIIDISLLLPPDKISLKHMKFIEYSIRESNYNDSLSADISTKILPVLIDNNMKEHLLFLLKTIFDFKRTNEVDIFNEEESLIKKYWLHEAMKRYSTDMAKIVGNDGLVIIIGIMKEVIERNEGAFYYGRRISIADHEQNRSDDKYENQLIIFLRDILETIPSTDIYEVVNHLLEEKHSIFIRFSFYTINYHYMELKNLLWSWLKEEGDTYTPALKYELFNLFEQQCERFTEEEIGLIIEWVENINYDQFAENRTDEEFEKIVAYRRKEWLLTIKNVSSRANDLFDGYDKVAPGEISNPGLDIYWSSGSFVGHESPIKDLDNFCKKSVKKIVSRILNFNPSKIKKQDFTTNDDLVQGLANDLAECVRKNPKKFIKKIHLFHSLDYIYIYHVFYGFDKAWQDKQKFSWNNLLDFMLTTLDDKLFKSEDKYADWIKGEVATLIQKGTQHDETAFEKKLLPKAKTILFRLIKHRQKDEVNVENVLSYSLNTPNGKALHALMSYTLRYGRLNSENEVKWEKKVKNFFTTELNKNNSYSIYIFSILGQYLDNLQFLDKEWEKNNFDKIFPLKNNTLWEASMSGYMSSSTVVYQDIYSLFKRKGHLQKGLKYSFKHEKVREKIIQHICIAFMNNFDVKTIFKVINQERTEDTLEVIRFIWQVYRENNKIDMENINKLWKTLFMKYGQDISEDSMQIFSTLSKWFVFIEKIDEINYDWLKLSVIYTEKNFNAYYVTQELLRLVDNNAHYVGKLVLQMLESDVDLVYNEDDIIQIVDKLFELNEKENAQLICNNFFRKGIWFLRDIEKKHSENKKVEDE